MAKEAVNVKVEGEPGKGESDIHVWDNNKQRTEFYRETLYQMIAKNAKGKK